MQSIYTHQSSNVLKTYVLMALFLSFLGLIGYYFSHYYQNPSIFYFAIIISLFMNFFGFWYSDKIALAVSKARPATREEFFDLYTTTENLSITAGLPMPKIYIIDDDSLNAFATGRDKNHSSIAITTGLLDKLEKTELEGVLAHELSHIGNRDILLMSIVVVLVGIVSILSDIFLRNLWFGNNKENKGTSIFAVLGIILIILSPIISMLIKFAISRKREFLADASAVMLTRYPEGLAKALEKIGNHKKPLYSASHATAHLFISNPFGSKNLGNLFSTHPRIEERIEILRKM
jgi:heat shock protein HtpX